MLRKVYKKREEVLDLVEEWKSWMVEKFILPSFEGEGRKSSWELFLGSKLRFSGEGLSCLVRKKNE